MNVPDSVQQRQRNLRSESHKRISLFFYIIAQLPSGNLVVLSATSEKLETRTKQKPAIPWLRMRLFSNTVTWQEYLHRTGTNSKSQAPRAVLNYSQRLVIHDLIFWFLVVQYKCRVHLPSLGISRHLNLWLNQRLHSGLSLSVRTSLSIPEREHYSALWLCEYFAFLFYLPLNSK